MKAYSLFDLPLETVLRFITLMNPYNWSSEYLLVETEKIPGLPYIHVKEHESEELLHADSDDFEGKKTVTAAEMLRFLHSEDGGYDEETIRTDCHILVTVTD